MGSNIANDDVVPMHIKEFGRKVGDVVDSEPYYSDELSAAS